MARTQLKILAFLMALTITLCCIAAAYYVYSKILSPSQQLEAELEQLRATNIKRPDPAIKRFEAAMALVRAGQIPQAREALYKLLQQFPKSALAAESRRIIGEINLDELFSPDQKTGKLGYIVQPGDSLALIASRQSTNMDMIIRLNGLMGGTLKPGDRLLIAPLDFSLVADLANQSLTLRRRAADREYFFKEYSAEIRLPGGLKAPAELELRSKSATLNGQPVLSSDPKHLTADKIIPTNRAGLVIRRRPAQAPQAQTAGNQPAARDPGIFLAPEQFEELFALVRNGSKLYLIR